MNPTKGVPPLIVARQDPTRSEDQCAWFLLCAEPAYADVSHPTLGDVPICKGHLEWLQEDA